MLKKVLYFNIAELDNLFGIPFIINQFDIPANATLKDYLDGTLGESNYPSVQTDITNANVIKLWKGVFDKFFYNAIVKIVLPFDTPDSYLDSDEFSALQEKEYYKEFLDSEIKEIDDITTARFNL